MVYACIDIGSNTTRLLVAEPAGGQLKELLSQRSFTRIGRALTGDGAIAKKKVREVAGVVATQARMARELGALEVEAVATAAIREASNRDELVEAVRRDAGLGLDVLTFESEARLAFVGATKTLGHPAPGPIAVVDVGGGSSEIAVGTVAGGMKWCASLRIGSGVLADAYLRSDPPSASELHAVREHVAGAFEGLEIPGVERAVAVGGSATSLRRLVGVELEHEALERGLRILASGRVEEVAGRFDLDPERARLLPAGMLILEEASDRLGWPLRIGKGGLREGVILERLAEGADGAAQGKNAA